MKTRTEKALRAVFAALFLAAGILSVLYSFTVMKVRSGSKFFLFWAAAGVVLVLLAAAIFTGVLTRLPLVLRRIFLTVVILGAVLVCTILALIFSCYGRDPQPGLDYIIVLGAQVLPDRSPSIVLTYRLEAAHDYLVSNPGTGCIVSGAQGSNEPCTEAEGMRDYLVAHGIAPDRIILEEQATNTRGNIMYSRELLPEGATVGIVTNRFHMYRSLFLCRKFGIEGAVPVNADSSTLYEPNNVMREVFGIIKDFIF